jgi:ribosomal protein S19
MIRSKWKLIFVDKPVFKFYEKEQQNSFFSRKGVVVENRSSTITDLAIDKKFSVPSGQNYAKIIVSESQVGMKFGSLCLTKRIGKSMHLYNKVQKKQSERKRALKQKKLNRNKVGKKAKLKMRSQRLKQMRAKIKAKKKKEI